MTDGILVIAKPKGLTSHQVVSLVRRLFPGVKVGHAGTLDPMATGVLPLCLGRATRLSEYIAAQPKEYLAEVTLGTETDTEDATGTVISQKEVPSLSKEEIAEVLNTFLGVTEQLPPYYSAVKHKGKPLYRWARAGVKPPRKARQIIIYKIELTEIYFKERPAFSFQVACSKGTYVRTLAAAIGQKIGCGAHLSALSRLRVGPYLLEEAHTMAELEQRAGNKTLADLLKAPDTALFHLGALTISDFGIKHLSCGRPLEMPEAAEGGPTEGLYRIYRENGSFVALARLEMSRQQSRLRTVKYFER